VPGAPVLTTASDTGPVIPNIAPYDSDKDTNLNTPTFTVTAPANAIVNLYATPTTGGATVLIGSGTITSGTLSIISSALADDFYDITATETDIAGNTSVVSSALTIQVDTTKPDAPSAPDLDDVSSDSGLDNQDDITNVTTPTFTGDGAEPGAYIEIFDAFND